MRRRRNLKFHNHEVMLASPRSSSLALPSRSSPERDGDGEKEAEEEEHRRREREHRVWERGDEIGGEERREAARGLGERRCGDWRLGFSTAWAQLIYYTRDKKSMVRIESNV